MKKLKKFHEYNKTDRIFLIIFVIIPIVCLMPLLADRIRDRHFNSYTASDVLSVGIGKSIVGVPGVMQGDVLEQSFVCNCYSVAGITVYADEYLNNGKGTVRFDLTDASRNVLETWDVGMADIGEDGIIQLKIDHPTKRLDMAGKECFIRIYTPEVNDNKHFSMASANNCYDSGALYVNGEDSYTDLIMVINGVSSIINNDHVKVWLCLYVIFGLEALALYIRKAVSGRRLIGEV